jgi:type VI secretion system protein ImpC
MAPVVRVKVENKLSEDPDAPKLAIDLGFRSMDDFKPAHVVGQVPVLRELLRLRTQLRDLAMVISRNDKADDLLQKAASTLRQDTDVGELSRRIADEGRIGQDYEARERGAGWVATFLEQVLAGWITVSRDPLMMIHARIAQLDHLLSIQLNEILHHLEFQTLEATWRGLKYLVDQAETSPSHRIFVLNAALREMADDIRAAADFRDTDLYARLSQPLESLGGAPYGCVILAHSFSTSIESLEILNEVASMGRSIHAPVLASPSGNWLEAPDGRRISMVSPEVAANWKVFRRTEQARFLVLVLPRILLRLPFGTGYGGAEGGRIYLGMVEEFQYEEGVDGYDMSRYLWGSPVFALASRISAAWARHGWCAAIQSSEGGGLVEGLPVHYFRRDEGDLTAHPATEMVITERAESELFDLGFCSLCQYRHRNEAVFPRVPTCRQPGGYLDSDANWNDRFGSQLPFVLAIVRDQRGGFTSPQHCEDTLNRWLANWVLLDDSAAASAKAAFPLREAMITVDHAPDGDGWVAALFLLPHYQLDGLRARLRMLIELPAH